MLVILPPPPPPTAFYHATPGLKGLGSTIMTSDQIYQLARSVGFPPDMAVKMTAVALRESTGDPTAYNGNTATGDDSYGLWQINFYDPKDPGYGARLMSQLGITDKSQLFDPVANAQAAYKMWNGSDQNFNIAWGYKDYSAWLPEAVTAAAGTDPTVMAGLNPVDDTGSSAPGTQTALVIGGLVLAFLVLKV